MMRPFTLVCMVSAFGAGLYLYQCKHQAQVLDRDIARTVKQTEAARERTGMLRAEWALLNEPDRLADLARAHTNLQTLKPTQFVAQNDLASRLPAIVTPGHETAPERETAPAEPEAEAMPSVAQATPPTVLGKPRDAAPAGAAAEKPVVTAEAKPVPPKHPDRPKPTKPEIAAAAPVHMQPHYSPAATVANNDATAPGTVGAAVLRAMRAQNSAYLQPAASAGPAYAAPAYQAPAYQAPAYAAPAVSVLGGSRALPAPVPFAAR